MHRHFWVTTRELCRSTYCGAFWQMFVYIDLTCHHLVTVGQIRYQCRTTMKYVWRLLVTSDGFSYYRTFRQRLTQVWRWVTVTVSRHIPRAGVAFRYSIWLTIGSHVLNDNCAYLVHKISHTVSYVTSTYAYSDSISSDKTLPYVIAW